MTNKSEHETYRHLKPLDETIVKRRGLFALMHGTHNDEPFKERFIRWVKQFMKQGFATIGIFGLFYVLINAQSLAEIVRWEYQKRMFGAAPEVAQITQLVQEKSIAQKPLPIAKTQLDARKQIPQLAMTVAPPDTRLVIPRINRNVPIVTVSTEALIKKDWNKLEKDMQDSLRYGVINYPGTARPGQKGNVVITGHSSYFPWDPGRFKDVFVILNEVKLGDKVLIYQNQKRYIYEVNNIKTIKPSELDILKPDDENKLTLITCVPIGTNLRRLVVSAKLIKVES